MAWNARKTKPEPSMSVSVGTGRPSRQRIEVVWPASRPGGIIMSRSPVKVP
jgi:hypothetical protein